MTPTNTPDALRLAQEREAFESHWYNFYHMGSIKARADGTYMAKASQFAWEAWQARAEVEKLRQAQGGEAVLYIRPAELKKALELGRPGANICPALSVSQDDEFSQALYTSPPLQADACRYPDCKCPTENPCLKGLPQADACKVPQGFKLVPVHPTEQMLDAAKKETWIGQNYASKCWAAMLSAAPTQVETQGDKAVDTAGVFPEWKDGNTAFKQWCWQYFGPDADESYLAEAVLQLPRKQILPMKAADEFELHRLLAEERYTVRQLNRALREATEAPTFMGEPITHQMGSCKAPQWQPIETAPKDGTMFLCWVEAVRYGETDEGQPHQQDASQPDFCWWRDDLYGNGYFDPACGQIGDSQHVTHWMPLPAAPSTPPIEP